LFSGSSAVRTPRSARWLPRERSQSGTSSAPTYTSGPTNGAIVIRITSTYTQTVLRPVLMQ
jgi:hypothetical protein